MSVILRVDDFPGTKPEEFWKHNLDNFKRFDEVIEKNGIPEYILGVIPKYTSEKDLDWLAQNPRVRVALHGIEHDERFPNEFRDHETREDIYRKIVSAIQPLKRCNGNGKVDCYIPPHNVIDLKTVGILHAAYFETLMCGPGSDDLPMRYAKELGMNVLYSSHPLFYGRSDEMMNRDKSVEAILANPAGVVTLLWTWEWNIGLDNLDKFLGQVNEVFR